MAGASPRIGFIGLGNMGLPMAQRVRLAKLPLAVWNRSAKPGPDGAQVLGSPAELLQWSDVVGLCVTDTKAVEAVCFGPGGLASVGRSAVGKVVVDFSSIAPEAAAAIAQRMKAECGIGWIDAPVSGGVPAAEAGSLIVFAGGDAADIATARPLFEAVSSKVTHMGPSGAGQATKVCNQMIVSANMMVLAETFATARAAGVDVARLTDALAGGFADSKPLQIFGPRMAARHYQPRQSSIAIMAKDAGLAQTMAREAGVETPLGALSASLYQGARDRPEVDFDGDISGLVELYETKKG